MARQSTKKVGGSYWSNRIADEQNALTTKNIKEVEKQMVKYYQQTAQSTVDRFESLYNQVLAKIADGKELTAADLYNLDKYWQMQAQVRQELQKLGEKEIVAMTKQFEINYFEVYNSLNIEGMEAFATIDNQAIKTAIETVWCADGRHFSSRVWKNTDQLLETLNQELVNSLVTGKKTSDLKKKLIERFNVSYNNADMIVKTEMAHIQTISAQQRYKDYGIKEMEVFVDEDERTCPECSKHEGERYKVTDRMPVPFHPRCRCCMIPVIE